VSRAGGGGPAPPGEAGVQSKRLPKAAAAPVVASQNGPHPRQVELSVGRPSNPTWKRPPGRPHTKWTDQLRRPLRLCGGKLLVAVTRERRYGPSRLRVNEDDTQVL